MLRCGKQSPTPNRSVAFGPKSRLIVFLRSSDPADVPAGAFWSVSLYNADGFFEPNPLDAYTVNSVTGTPNDDGSMTVHLGGCDDGRVNCLPIMEGWNYTVRLYQPGQEVLEGKYKFPSVETVQ
jgi:hypothetical protein